MQREPSPRVTRSNAEAHRGLGGGTHAAEGRGTEPLDRRATASGFGTSRQARAVGLALDEGGRQVGQSCRGVPPDQIK